MSEISGDPARLYTLKLRINRRAEKTFVFTENDLAMDVSEGTWELFVKKYPGDKKKVISLTLGNGLEIPIYQDDRFVASFTALQTRLEKGNYYFELVRTDIEKTYLNGICKVYFGPEDNAPDNDTVSVDVSNEDVNVSTLQDITILYNGTKVGTTKALNFVPGSNVTIDVQKVGEKINVTIASSGGGGSGDLTFPYVADSIVFQTKVDGQFPNGGLYAINDSNNHRSGIQVTNTATGVESHSVDIQTTGGTLATPHVGINSIDAGASKKAIVAVDAEGGIKLQSSNLANVGNSITVETDAVKIDGITEVQTAQVIYYDSTTKEITYGTAPSGTALTNGNGTTANGSAVDLGGTLSADVSINGGGFAIEMTDGSLFIFATAGSSNGFDLSELNSMFQLSSLPAAVTDKILYWNGATGEVTQGDPSGGGGGTWGSITGTLSSQADLQGELNDKSDATITYTSKTGAYTMAAAELTVLNAGGSLEMVSTGGGALTVPNNATLAIPVGKWFSIRGFTSIISGGDTWSGTDGTLNIATGTTAAAQKTGTTTWTLHNGPASTAASETEAGIVELATSAETLTGTDTTRATTPAGVKAVADTKLAHTNSAGALTDGATIDLTDTKHTLASSSATRTFTISYTGDDIVMQVTLSTTAATYTFPATALCVSEGVASGDNTLPLSGVSGDKYIITIKKIGSAYYVVSKNFGQ